VVIIGAIAELERNLIIERVPAGMHRAKLEGRHVGRRTLELSGEAILLEHHQARTWVRSPEPMGSPGLPSTASSTNSLPRRKSHEPGTHSLPTLMDVDRRRHRLHRR
jgi:hypothetical protein